MKKTTWKILGKDVEMFGEPGNYFVNRPDVALELGLFAGMKSEEQANRLAKNCNVEWPCCQDVRIGAECQECKEGEGD